jgi:L-alanine-DL-glutamate epimerase-like enolase superfamily enzyme
LKIESLETVRFALPFREPYVTARGRLVRRELLLVRIRADGVEGLGEAAPLALRGGASLADIERDLLERCAPLLGGREFSGWEEAASACESLAVSAQALAAVELGLLDLAGRLAGEPAWRVLGAERARPVRCNATLVAGPPDAVADSARAWAARGFETFKLKAGVEGDVEQAQAVRAAVGQGARIRLDANGAWSSDEAVAKLGRLNEVGLELVEQPSGTLEELRSVRERVEVPVAADESVASEGDAREAVAVAACDAATVKIAKVGGARAARAIAAVLPVYLSSALDGPVGIAAAAHLAQVLPRPGIAAGLAQGLATSELFDATIATSQCELGDAALTVPEGPGLGVTIDEDALARFRIGGPRG